MKLRLPSRRDSRSPHVEVVVPCYNYGHFLPLCIESVVSQKQVRVTVTIVDDASTDDSAAVARELTKRYENVSLIQNSVNLGAVRTFNVGLRRASSDYVVLISADDLLTPGSLHRAVSLMEAHPRVGLVFGHARKFSDQLPKLHAPIPFVSWTIWRGEKWIRLQLRRGWNNISSPEVVVRTEVQHRVGYYDEALPRTHDVEMWLRIAAVSDVGHVNGVDQAFYRRHQGSHSSQFSGFDDVRERWRAYNSFLSGSHAAELASSGQHVRRKLAREVLRDLLDLLDEHPESDREAVHAALYLAKDLDPESASSKAWGDIERRLQGRHATHIGPHRRAIVRSVARAARWRRWRRFRYLG